MAFLMELLTIANAIKLAKAPFAIALGVAKEIFTFVWNGLIGIVAFVKYVWAHTPNSVKNTLTTSEAVKVILLSLITFATSGGVWDGVVNVIGLWAVHIGDILPSGANVALVVAILTAIADGIRRFRAGAPKTEASAS